MFSLRRGYTLKYFFQIISSNRYFTIVSLCKLPINVYDVLFEVFHEIPIQDDRGGEGPPTRFFPVTSTNVGIGPYNFLTFSFNPFATLV